jgi:hypothetical protein
MRPLVFLITIFLTLAVNVSGQITQGEKRVIFPQEKKVLIDITQDTLYKRFTPTLADIDSADVFLKQYLLTINKDKKHYQFDDYYRQYVGLFLKGRKCIFVNASCQKTEYFFENTYYPKGGGQCFFQTLVDSYNKKVLDFFFNAPK